MDFTEIQSLLSQGDLSDEQSARLEELYSSLEDGQLAALEASLTEEFDTIRAGENPAESITHLRALVAGVERVRLIAKDRLDTAAALAAAEAEATELAVAVHGAQQAAVVEPEAEEAEEVEETEETEEVAEEAVAEETEEVAEETPAETEEVEAEVEAEKVETEPEAEAEEAEEEEEVEAEEVETEEANTGDPHEATVATATQEEIMSRTPKQFAAEPTHPTFELLRAGGGTFADFREIDEALVERSRDLMGTGPQGVGRFRVASITNPISEARQLPANKVTDVTEMVDEIRYAVTKRGGAESLTADGGLCAPVENFYGLANISQASRPLRDALPVFQARRGGIQYMRPLSIADINATTTPTSDYAIGVVTEANDASSTYDKEYQTIDCGDLVTVKVDAVYNQLRFGNFIARTDAERVANFTDLSVAAYARFSERRLIDKMVANSTIVHAPQVLGALRDFLTRINQVAINYRARHRMPVDATLDTVIPAWVVGLLGDDQVNALQSYPEQYDVGRAKVEAWLSERNINVLNWFQDDFIDATVSDGPINAYPTSFKVLMFHPGAHTIVDNGVLDLGVYRDSTLIADNMFGTFSEEFWSEAMWGLESLAVTFALCASGASAGSVEPSCGS